MKTKGKSDILSMALGKEPSNRTRLQGTGKFLKPSMYYHFYTGNQLSEEYRSPWQSVIEAGIDEIRNMINTRPSFLEEGSCSFSQYKTNKSDEGEKLGVGQFVAGDGGEVKVKFLFI